MTFLLFVIYILVQCLQLYLLKKQQHLTRGTFQFYFCIPMFFFPFFLFGQGLYDLSYQILVGYGILSYFCVAIFQFLFYRKNILKNFPHRLFYQICILIYLYILVLLVLKKENFHTFGTISFESVFILIFFLAFLFIASFFSKKKERKTGSFSSFLVHFFLLLLSLGILFLLSYFFSQNIKLYSSFFLYFPVFLFSFFLLKEEKYSLYFLNTFFIPMYSILAFAIFDFIYLSVPIYSFVSKQTFQSLEHSLSFTALFLLPTLIKFPDFLNFLFALGLSLFFVFLFLI